MMTKKGRDFQNSVIPMIERAELETFASLSEQEQQIITDLWEKYTDLCISKLSNAMQIQNRGKDK